MDPKDCKGRGYMAKLFSPIYLNQIRNRHGEEVVARAMAALAVDVAGGLDVSTRAKAIRAMNGKLKYVRIVDEASKKQDIRIRSLWLLLKTGAKFRIGKIVVSVDGHNAFIDGRQGKNSDYFKRWVEREYMKAGWVVLPTDEGSAIQLDRFPILKEAL